MPVAVTRVANPRKPKKKNIVEETASKVCPDTSVQKRNESMPSLRNRLLLTVKSHLAPIKALVQ